ncbi:MAG: heme-copper oxidase subunit III [Micrococcales bacterium]
MSTVSAQHSAPVINRPSATSVGTIVWLGSEVMFFAGLFAMYFSLRANSPELWAEKTADLDVPFALTNTLILVASSFTAQFGVFAAERMQPRKTGRLWQLNKWGMVEWFFLSYIMGAIFVSGQAWEYTNLITKDGIMLSSDSYGSSFYITTGFHALHVTGGLVAFLLVIGRTYAAKKFGHYEATSAIVVSYYWHFVDVVWIGLFMIIYVLK